MKFRRATFLLGIVAAGATAPPALAAVWKRTRPDGTVEFTNVEPAGRGWNAVRGIPRPTAAPAGARAVEVGRTEGFRPSPSSTVWMRKGRDGTLEFTNLRPIGARWKVLFRTGPGKASALRGSSDVVPARDLSSERFARFDRHIRDQQAIYGVPEALVRAVIKTESDFDPRVISSAGAQGLMQLMPDTAREMGVTDVWDPRQNIMGGARYLQLLARRFCRTPLRTGATAGLGLGCSLEEKVKVLAGYHAGPGAVEKYAGLPPYETTRSYVTTVLRRYEDFRRREAAGAGAVAAQ